jgi:NCAIR mutase (PurE)-related protein
VKARRTIKNRGGSLRELAASTEEIAGIAKMLSNSSSLPVHNFAEVDVSRFDRTSFPEIIYCENKRVEQIAAIARRLHAHGTIVLGTRCPPEFFPRLKKTFRNGYFVREAQSFRVGKPLATIPDARVSIISAGTTDITACEEAALILETLGVAIQRVYDVGVAGIHRLFASHSRIHESDVLIVAAGMEGALPSVIAGMYHQPIIAIPTSVGYGTALGGFTALFAMLTSCAPGVTVVNINNGVGAAAAAYKIVRLMKSKQKGTA